MKLSIWRTNLVTWLSSKVHIDNWELHEPLYPGITHAFLAPLRNLKTFTNDSGQLLSKATQEVWLTTMYNRDLKYYELPINVIEGAYSSLCQQFLMESINIAPILDLELIDSDQPIQVIEYGDDQADWLVRMVLYVNITWVPELEDNLIEPTYPVININTRIFRSYIPNFNDNILDYPK